MIEPRQRPNVVDVRDGLLHRQVVDADAENAAVAAQCTGMKGELGIASCAVASERRRDGNIAEVSRTRRWF